MRRVAVAALVVLAGCSSGKGRPIEKQIPHVVHAGEAAACKADTATLKTQEETSFAATDAYTEQTTPLHKVTVTGATYAITVADPRCGTVGHTVGQTPQDN